ncbi:MAG TPA: FecR domain-containing protein [Vicinamibacteria bacterium]|nr:FecR domain-containing protein [Vicinamibacteria bacterium]
MASEEPVAPETEILAATEVTRPPRKPFYKDPLSIIGWGIAVASIVAYWYFFVRKPVPRLGQQVARLTGVQGKVKVKANARDAWENARLSDQLHVGDVVQTETRAGAEISFNSGSRVNVRPDSVVYIGGSAEASTAAWRVQSGRVNFSVGDETTEIVTPTVRTTALQNASGNIDVTDAGETGVKIFRGQAEVETTQGQKITLTENQAVQVDAAGKAGATLHLPPPPTLIAPTAKARLPLVAPPDASARLSWNAVQNGVTYHVAMDYNVTQANLLLSAALDEPGVAGTSHDLKGLSLGRYFWRVSAVNKDGLEGAFSRVSSFAVVEPESPPQPTPTPGVAPPVLVLQALDEVAPGVVHVGGRTDPGATLLVNGTAVRVMPDGSFSEHVRGSGPGEVVIRATGADGQFTEQARAVSKR